MPQSRIELTSRHLKIFILNDFGERARENPFCKRGFLVKNIQKHTNQFFLIFTESRAFQITPERNTEEKRPATIPMMRGNAKSRIASTPRI